MMTKKRYGYAGHDWGRITRDEFITLFPKTDNKVLAEVAELPFSTIIGRAWHMGLKKDPDWVKTRHKENYENNRELIRKSQLGHGARHNGDKLRGKALSVEHRAQLSASAKASPNVKRGSDHPKWKGGNTNQRYLGSTAYQDWRRAVLDRDGYRCRCPDHEEGFLSNKLHAHHVKPWADHEALRLDVANGLSVCVRCHHRIHGWKPPEETYKLCDCGCGFAMRAFNVLGKLREYIHGHDPRSRERHGGCPPKNTLRMRRHRSAREQVPTDATIVTFTQEMRDKLTQKAKQPKPQHVIDALFAGRTERWRRYHEQKATQPEVPQPPEETKPCACGCGRTINSYTKRGEPRDYFPNHSPEQRVALATVVSQVQQSNSKLLPDAEAIVIRYQQGSSLEMIARDYGVSTATVANFLERLGIPRRHSRNSINSKNFRR